MKSFMFRLPVVGSTACGLFLSVCLVQAAYAEIIDLNARSAAFDSPVEVFLDAGTYSVTPVGIVGGGTYDSWTPWSVVNCGNPLGCTQTWPTTATGYLTSYVVLSDALESVTVDGVALNPTAAFPTPTVVSIFVSGAPAPWGGTWYTVRPAIVYPDPVSALASATTSTFTLAYPAIVGFASGDLLSVSYDNSGGISLLVVPVVGDVNNELRNIATRAEVRTDDEIVIGGFVIVGNTQKCVVIQALGGSVAVPAGVTRLADPTMELKSGLTTIAQNDNWQDQTIPSDVQLIIDSGRAPNDILEAAIYKCLDPGAYTALVRGFQQSTGLGIVAVYDADDSSPYLKNIATRSWVGTQHSISIAGFVVTGSTPKQILVRGLGPSMQEKFPQLGALSDPRLRLFKGPTEIATNDNWGDAANAGEIGALAPPLPPTHAKEPAILMILQPGLYTAHMLGVGGEKGIGNVAVYDLTGRQ